MEDFSASGDGRAEVFIHWVRLCSIVGRVGKHLSRDTQSPTFPADLAQALIDWVHNLPEHLVLPIMTERTLTFNRDVHNLHLPYLTTLTILHMSRFTQSSSQQIPEAYTAAILAASCVARIFKDYLARGGIRFLGGISSWYVGIALMALSHTQRIETLAKSGWEDVKVLQQALSNLATEWPSAAVFVKGFERLRLFDQPASKLGQDAFNSLYQNTPDESTSPTLSDGDVFSGIDWVRYFPFATAQTSSLARILLAKHQTDLWADISWLGDPSSHLQTFFDSSEMYFDVMGHS